MKAIRTYVLMYRFITLILVTGVFGSGAHTVLAALSDHFDQFEMVVDIDMEEEESEKEEKEKKDRYVKKKTSSNIFTAHSNIIQNEGSFQALSHCEEILTPPPEQSSC